MNYISDVQLGSFLTVRALQTAKLHML